MRVKILKRGHARRGLYVSNHLSYLDMMVLAALKPSVFVTSVDMGQVFFLGTMAEIGGSLFIERRHRERVGHDVRQLEEALREGYDVTLFPEGTSGNGDTVLPFKRSLLASAMNTGSPVVPVTIKYFEIEGRPFDFSNRDVVCWYGRKAFLPHFLTLLSASSVRVKVTYDQPINYAPETTKLEVCDELHRVITREYAGL